MHLVPLGFKVKQETKDQMAMLDFQEILATLAYQAQLDQLEMLANQALKDQGYSCLFKFTYAWKIIILSEADASHLSLYSNFLI